MALFRHSIFKKIHRRTW